MATPDMLHPAIPVLLLALVAPAVASIGDPVPQMGRSVDTHVARPAPLEGVTIAQLTVRERIIIRVPRMSTLPGAVQTGAALRASVPVPLHFKEKKGPKCVAAADLGGARIVQPGIVDLVLTGDRRIRARLDRDCAPIDYYRGFYLRPAADGKVCAGRDVIRVRSGESCAIVTFKTLQVAR